LGYLLFERFRPILPIKKREKDFVRFGHQDSFSFKEKRVPKFLLVKSLCFGLDDLVERKALSFRASDSAETIAVYYDPNIKIFDQILRDYQSAGLGFDCL
jgi:hypothetical protein